MRPLVNVFKALADETRLQMLGLLLERGELCVCDFVQVLGITQSKASRHLRHLVNAGLLADRREAVWVYFRIAEAPEAAPARLLEALPSVLAEHFPKELHHRLAEWNARKRQAGSCCE